MYRIQLILCFFAFAKCLSAQEVGVDSLQLVSPKDTLVQDNDAFELKKKSKPIATESMVLTEPSRRKKKKVKKEREPLFAYKNGYPNPKKSLLFSIAVPGAGQVYNGDWWKAPIAVAAVGTSVYFYANNQRNYARYRDAYIARQAGEDPAGFENLSTTVIGSFRDQYDNRRQYTLLAVIATSFFQAGEAFASAHLASFEVNEDLSLRVKQHAEPTLTGTPALGLAVSLNW